MLIPPIFFDLIVFSSLMSLLSTGVTLAYVTTKLPNLTQGSLVTIGAYISLTAAEVWHQNPYATTILAFVIGGGAAALIYRLALRPQIKRKAPSMSLMVATLAVWIFFVGLLNMYADYLQFVVQISSRGFLLNQFDFHIAGEPGVLFVSTAFSVMLIVGLFVLLTKTDFGIGLRATAENPSLAQAIGIDIDRVNYFSWFLSGGLAAAAGSLIPFWFFSSNDIGDVLLIGMFAASVLGGLTSIFGAIVGGYLIGVIQILGTYALANVVGNWIITYQPVLPLAALIIVLLVIPNGIGGTNWRNLLKRQQKR